jgi:DNA-binding phage protein
MASGIADGSKNIAYMIKQFEALKPVILVVGAALLVAFAPVVAAVAALGYILAKGGSNLKKAQYAQGKIPGGMGNISTSVSSQDTQRADTAARKKAEKDALNLTKTSNSLKKIDNDLTARKLGLTGDEKALAELEKKFDVERIGLYTALNQTTDSETKMRLYSLIAIKDQNAALAGMIKKANEADDALKAFTEAIRATVRAMLDLISGQLSQLKVLTGNTGSDMPENAGGINPPNYGALDVPLNAGSFAIGERDTLRAMGINVTINNAGSVVTTQDLVAQITQGIYNNQASGIPINYSTAY